MRFRQVGRRRNGRGRGSVWMHSCHGPAVAKVRMRSVYYGFIALAALVAPATPQMQAPGPGVDSAPTEIVTADGTRLHYRVDGDGRPLVILHGGPGLSSSYLTPDL